MSGQFSQQLLILSSQHLIVQTYQYDNDGKNHKCLRKQCRPWSVCSGAVWSGSTLFAILSPITDASWDCQINLFNI